MLRILRMSFEYFSSLLRIFPLLNWFYFFCIVLLNLKQLSSLRYFYFSKKSVIFHAIHLFDLTLLEFFTSLYPGIFWEEEKKGNYRSNIICTIFLRNMINFDPDFGISRKNSYIIFYQFPHVWNDVNPVWNLLLQYSNPKRERSNLF